LTGVGPRPRAGWYARRAIETVHYEGLHILLWRVLAQGLAPVGTVQPWTFYRRDLTQPLAPVRARADVTITLATEADREQLAAMVVRRYGPTGLGPYAALGVPGTIAHRFRRGLRCFVARAGAEIVHYNWIAFGREPSLGEAGARIELGPGEAYCSDAYTAEAWRGRGIHTAVLNAMLLFLQQAGYRTAWTDVGTDNKSSWKTHERLGWTVSGTALDFTPRGGRRTWRWRLRGSLRPFTVQEGRWLSLPGAPDPPGPDQPPR
jgi:GNAT superfamily N-acetyltransferase